MDFWAALQELHQERKRLDTIIRTLELLMQGEQPHMRRRGRKDMPAHERKLVSERMKNYWETRRRRQLSSDGDPEPSA